MSFYAFHDDSASRRERSRSRGAGAAIDRLLTTNEERVVALQAGNTRLARSALREVAADLQDLLTEAAAQLAGSRDQQIRQHVKTIVKRDLAASTAAALPLHEIADLLDIDRRQVTVVLDSLHTQGGLDEATRLAGLREIQHLRQQLRSAVQTEDHSLLDRLVSFIVKIAQAVAIAVATAATSTLAVGDGLVTSAAVKAAVVALVTLALESAATAIRDRRNERNPYTVARDALADLTAELERIRTPLGTEPAYAFERPVSQIRTLVKIYKAQQALIEIQWTNKAVCWNTLGYLAIHLAHSTDTSAESLNRLLRQLQAVQLDFPNG